MIPVMTGAKFWHCQVSLEMSSGMPIYWGRMELWNSYTIARALIAFYLLKKCVCKEQF